MSWEWGVLIIGVSWFVRYKTPEMLVDLSSLDGDKGCCTPSTWDTGEDSGNHSETTGVPTLSDVVNCASFRHNMLFCHSSVIEGRTFFKLLLQFHCKVSLHTTFGWGFGQLWCGEGTAPIVFWSICVWLEAVMSLQNSVVWLLGEIPWGGVSHSPWGAFPRALRRLSVSGICWRFWKFIGV